MNGSDDTSNEDVMKWNSFRDGDGTNTNYVKEKRKFWFRNNNSSLTKTISSIEMEIINRSNIAVPDPEIMHDTEVQTEPAEFDGAIIMDDDNYRG